MSSGYYWVGQAFPPAGRWYLSAVRDDHGYEIDTSAFLRGEAVELGLPLCLPLVGGGTTALAGPVQIDVSRSGPALNFTLGAFDLPILSARLAAVLGPLVGADAQWIPARVESQDEPFAVMNVLSRPACVDVARSQIEWWTPPGAPPGSPEQPFAMYEMVLDPTRARGHHVLRPAECPSALVVSSAVKEAMERFGALGVQFTAV